MAWDPFKDGGAIAEWDPFRDGGAVPDQPDSSYVGDKAKRVARSAVESTGDVIAGAGQVGPSTHRITDRIADKALELLYGRKALPEEIAARERMRSEVAQRTGGGARALQGAGAEVRKLGEFYETDPRRDEEFGSKVAQALGSLPPVLATAPLGPVAAGSTAAMMGGEAGRREAEERGASADQQAAAFALNAPVAAASEALLGAPALLKSLANPQALTPLLRIGEQVIKGAVREGAQEAIEQLAGNVIAKDVVGYAPERGRMEGVVEAGAIGALVGGGVGGAFGGAAEVDRRRASASDAPTDTGRNVPESRDTLQAQQEQLLAGRRVAQMFPQGTAELELPEGLARVETGRGVFHFDPARVSAERIQAASAAGRENDVLALGPLSKADVDARVAQGDERVAVTERTPEGVEVKTAVSTRGAAEQTAAELEWTKTPGNRVAVEPVEGVVRERTQNLQPPGKETRPAPAETPAASARRSGIVSELLSRDAQTAEEQRLQRAREAIARESRQRELAEKRARFEERMGVALETQRKPDASFAEVNGALESVKFYAEDNALGLTQEQRETAKRAQAAMEQRLARLQAEENARREREQQERAAAGRAEEAARREQRKAERKEFRAAEAAGIGASGAFDYAQAPMAALEQRAEQGDERAVEAIARRSALEGDGREELLGVLRQVKLPGSDAALGGELGQLIREGMTDRQRRELVSSEGKSLDRTAEALRERGFSSVQTPADVLEVVGRALRGEKIFAERGGDVQQVEFATGERASASDAPTEIEREIAAIRKAAPQLVRKVDLEIGNVQRALRERGYQGAVPEEVQAALARLQGEKALIVLSARAYRSRRKGAALLVHEVAHAYWDMMPVATKGDLREMHAREVEAKTGPLYENGVLQSELQFVEDMDENGHKEWFAERMARLHEDWLKLKIDRAEAGLLRQLAHEIREFVRKVWAALARAEGISPESELFVAQFRKFFESGADARIGRAAGVAWDRAMTPAFARGEGAKVEFAAEDVTEKRFEQLREQFDALTAEGEELKRELDALNRREDKESEVEGKIRVDQIRENERTTKAVYAQLTALRAKLDAKNPVKPKLPEGKSAEQIIAEAARVEALPKTDRKGALLAEWRYGKEMRDKALKVGNDTAFEEGQRLVNRAKARLDDEFPGWERDAYASRGESGKLKVERPRLTPAAEPVPGDESDAEKSPFAGPEKDLPVRGGKLAEVYGHGGVEPTFLARTWEKVRSVLAGFKGAVPELPTFAGAKWNQADAFIREHGANFYNRLREGVRKLNGANDPVQRAAEEDVAKIVRPLIEAGGEFSANDYAKLRKLQERARRAKGEGKPVPEGVRLAIEALNSRMEASPYVLFNKVALLLDLNWRHNNLKDSQGNPIALPAGINAEEIRVELERLGERIAASGHEDAIRAALEQHMALVKRVADDLKARELMAAEALQNPYYFPHVTLEVTRGGKTEQRELRPERVRVDMEADFRGYLVDPVGSTKAIETDYVRGMYFHLVQVGAHNAKADVVRDFFRPYDVKAEVERRAKELTKERGVPVSWEQAFHEEYAPRGYVLYGTNSGDAFPGITVDRDRLARRLGVILTGEDLHKQLAELGLKGVKLLPEDLEESLQMGARETWVLPARVAEALRGVVSRAERRDNAIEAAMKGAMGAWKGWKLFMPWNHIRYEYGNVVADVEKLLAASPGTFRRLPEAAKELREFWKGGAPSEDLRAAVREGVINAITAQEMGALSRLPAFREFETWQKKVAAETKAILSAPLANATRLVRGGVLGRVTSVEESAFREAVFRYAKFKHDLAAIRNGARPDYAGAYWKDIEAMEDSRPGAKDADVRKAAAISRATFGDYGDLSVAGQYMRDKLAPFWSWTEINFRYHANLLRNLRDMVRAGDMAKADAAKGGARALGVAAAGFSARAAGGLVLRMAIPYAAVLLWNNSGDREELEKLLSEEDRRRFHVILGEIGDEDEVPAGFERKVLRDGRKVLVMYANTALMDVARWFSGPQLVQTMAEVAQGKVSFATAFSRWRDQLVPDFVNNLAGSASPLFKVPYTIASGKNPFPDVTDQRTVPSHDMRRVILGQMTDEFVADQIERVVNKDYYAAKEVGDWARQLVLQARQRDPEAWAYYEIRDKADEFEYKMTGERSKPGERETRAGEVVRNFRKAIYRGDAENATRFYLRLLEYGYTAERLVASIRAADPLSGLAKKDGLRAAFVRSLSEDERAQLERAYVYYSRMTASKGRETALFPRERSGMAGQLRYLEQPRTEALQRMIETTNERSEEEELRRAERALRESLRRR